ncbi:MAG: hypothetical protein AAF799_32455 [Myxococcota bacterium]
MANAKKKTAKKKTAQKKAVNKKAGKKRTTGTRKAKKKKTAAKSGRKTPAIPTGVATELARLRKYFRTAARDIGNGKTVHGTTAWARMSELLEGLSSAQRRDYEAPRRSDKAGDLRSIKGRFFTVYYATSGRNAVTTAIAQRVSDTIDRVIQRFVDTFGTKFGWGSSGKAYFDATSAMYADAATKTIHFNADIFMRNDSNPAARDGFVTHEAFHAYQFGCGWSVSVTHAGTKQLTYWILEGTAVWAELEFSQLDGNSALTNPVTLTSWFDRPNDIRLANRTKPAQGYPTLPFWMWLARAYPTAFTSFITTAPAKTSWIVDQLAALVSRERDDEVGMEGVVTEFGAHLVLGDWLNSGYLPIYDIEQPTRTILEVPTFEVPADALHTGELNNNDSTWVSGSNSLPNASIGFFLAKYRLPERHDPSNTQAIFEVEDQTIIGAGTPSYFVVIEHPSTASIELFEVDSETTFPETRTFNDPKSANVYMIVSSDQHPIVTGFADDVELDFRARFGSS